MYPVLTHIKIIKQQKLREKITQLFSLKDVIIRLRFHFQVLFPRHQVLYFPR